MEHLGSMEHLELNGALGFQCSMRQRNDSSKKGMDHMRKEWSMRQRDKSSKRGKEAHTKGMKCLRRE